MPAWMICLPVLLPLAGALLSGCMQKGRLRNGAIALVLLIQCALCGAVALLAKEPCTLFALTEEITITLRVDGISRWFSLLMSGMWALVGVYSFGYLAHDGEDGRFYVFYLCTLSMLMGLCYAENLVTLYMFYELMTLLSLPLVAHERTKESVAAAIKYLLYSIFGASLVLFGMFVYARFGKSLSFAPGGVLAGFLQKENEGLVRVATFCMLVGFCVKAGMFPLHGWLPTAHPVAPAPASAVLSGVITKAGVVGCIRVAFFCAGADFLRGTWAQYAWMTLSLCTVFLGSMMAYREDLLKKRLAYSTVSQVSYVLFGLSTLNAVGFAGALLHAVFHSIIKNALFMNAGAVIHQTGCTRVSQLRGIGKRMPVAMWCFVLVSAGLIGVPPTAGFVSKWLLAQGALSAGAGAFAWAGPAVLLLSAILTAGYLLTIALRGFFPGDDFDYAACTRAEPGACMLTPMLLCGAATVLLGVAPGLLIQTASAIAAALL